MIRKHKWIYWAVLLLALTIAPGHAQVCDVDDDGDVDREDIDLIFDALYTPSSGPEDPRDENGDGMISATDGHRCAEQCTDPGCPSENQPVAVISNDDVGTPPYYGRCYGKTVTLDGSKSHSLKDRSLSFQWTLVMKPDDSTAEIFDANAETATFVPDVKGYYSVELIVNDGLNSKPTREGFTIEGPKASAGRDQPSVSVGETVKLNGGNSEACSDNALTYSWEIVKKPDGSTAELSDPTAVAPTFIADIAGQYEAELTVNDGIDGWPDTVRISNVATKLKCGNEYDGTVTGSERKILTFTARKYDVVKLTLNATSDNLFEANLRDPFGRYRVGLTTGYVRYPDPERESFVFPILRETGTYTIETYIPDADNKPDMVGKFNIQTECIRPTVPIEVKLSCGDRDEGELKPFLHNGEIKKFPEANLFTFEGEKDKHVKLTLSGVKQDSRVYVYAPIGDMHRVYDFNESTGGHTDRFSLPHTGTYAIIFGTYGQNTEKYSLELKCD